MAGFPHIPANMKSMTGYGRGECVQDGFKITVELSSVNRKQGEISVSLPRELEVLEAQIRNTINQKISRGRLNARVNLHSSSDQAAAAIRPNLPLARAYLRELKKLATELKLDDSVTLDQVIRAPGVLQAEDKVSDAEEFWPAVETALEQALNTLVKMREKEGAHLAADLKSRIKIMREAVATVESRAPEVMTRYREQLRDRVKSAGLELPAEYDDRLLKELVYYSDRSDISEELTRLASHFKQFDDYVKSREPVGRTLDFLSQEINREINTIGSKANDSLISREVVGLKTELEKFREQVQNIE